MARPPRRQPIRGEASIEIAAPAEDVYDLVTDVGRMGEWSPECTGGRWLGGVDGPTVGARFKGTNKNRVSWNTASRVAIADRGREFAFLRDRPRGFGVMRWAYRFEPGSAPGTVKVTESFERVETAHLWALLATERVTGVRWDDREMLNVRNMEATLARLKETAEQS